ncbi:MAG: hypothetical protein FGF53_02300 [Candidatus Brockarchaeota archaeon]|nr:hypothetical protein [Candidatus Brockarchaeota archaeon]MBO3808148.1 hypothetical protein [Candidatus Brockarchaeota archaeon]
MPVRKTLKALLYAVSSSLLFLSSVIIFWQLFTAEYPAHSDVFWKGVECGVLGILSLLLFALGLFLSTRVLKRVLGGPAF